MGFETRLHARVNKRGKIAFLQSLTAGPRVLDIGCGNRSPQKFKSAKPDIYYVGLDVADCNQDQQSLSFADEYIITNPENFTEEIQNFSHSFDAVVSAHNIEHCLFPEQTLRAMAKSLKLDGRMFLSFPCEESESFPRRKPTLNFFDDPTHVYLPNYKRILSILKEEGLRVDVAIKRHRPTILLIIGSLLEPVSAITGKCVPLTCTWALYGFETIIWATRSGDATAETAGRGAPPASASVSGFAEQPSEIETPVL